MEIISCYLENDINNVDFYNTYPFYLFLICTRLARIGETSIHSLLFIQILVIDIDWTFWNEVGRSTV